MAWSCIIITMSYPDWYKQISDPFRGETATAAINMFDRMLVFAIAIAYAVMLLILVASADIRLVKAILVPAITFGLVTYLRARINAPRPYDLYDIDPIIVKSTYRLSFPSRHVASAMIIACALAWIHLDWGVLAFIACGVVAFTRIVGGVHFPKDVAAGIAIAAACGLVGFVIIP